MTKKETNPDIKVFIDYAYKTHQDKFDVRLYINGRCGKIVERLLTVFKLQELKELWDKFLVLSDNDEFISEAGCSMPVFESCINKLQTGKRKKKSAIDVYVDMEDKDHAKDGQEGSKENNIVPFSRVAGNRPRQ